MAEEVTTRYMRKIGTNEIFIWTPHLDARRDILEDYIMPETPKTEDPVPSPSPSIKRGFGEKSKAERDKAWAKTVHQGG